MNASDQDILGVIARTHKKQSWYLKVDPSHRFTLAEKATVEI